MAKLPPRKLHLSQENTKILYGKSYTSLRKTQGFCMVKTTTGKHKGCFCLAKATPPVRKQKDLLIGVANATPP